MFYMIFKSGYLGVKRRIEIRNRKRISREVLPGGVTRTEYVYSDDGDNFHRFNLFKVSQSKDAGDDPLIIDIHGGGWISGDKDTNNNFCYHLALNGYHVTSLSYRTVDHCTMKEQIQDIFAYFHFLEDNAAHLGIGFDDVSLTGDSAGGQLALLAYCVNQEEKLQKLFSVAPVKFSPKCLILNHSVCYLNEAGKLPGKPITSRFISIPGLQRMLYGKNFIQDEIYQNTFSPMQYIHKASAMPPILLITSKGDRNYSYQTIKLYKDLMAAGQNCELYYEENPKAGHVFNVSYPDTKEGRQCNNHILQYLKNVRN